MLLLFFVYNNQAYNNRDEMKKYFNNVHFFSDGLVNFCSSTLVLYTNAHKLCLYKCVNLSIYL